MLSIYRKTNFITDPGYDCCIICGFSDRIYDPGRTGFLNPGYWKQQQMKFSALNAQLGFDRPFFVQYGDWIVGMYYMENWGNSYFLHDISQHTAIGEYFLPTIKSCNLLHRLLHSLFPSHLESYRSI